MPRQPAGPGPGDRPGRQPRAWHGTLPLETWLARAPWALPVFPPEDAKQTRTPGAARIRQEWSAREKRKKTGAPMARPTVFFRTAPPSPTRASLPIQHSPLCLNAHRAGAPEGRAIGSHRTAVAVHHQPSSRPPTSAGRAGRPPRARTENGEGMDWRGLSHTPPHGSRAWSSSHTRHPEECMSQLMGRAGLRRACPFFFLVRAAPLLATPTWLTPSSHILPHHSSRNHTQAASASASEAPPPLSELTAVGPLDG